MPKTPKEIERIILKDGWKLSRNSKDSHRQYNHPYKKGTVTIAFHNKDIPKKLYKIFANRHK